MVPKAVKNEQARSQARRRMHDKRHLLNSEGTEIPKVRKRLSLLNGATEALAPTDATDRNLADAPDKDQPDERIRGSLGRRSFSDLRHNVRHERRAKGRDAAFGTSARWRG